MNSLEKLDKVATKARADESRAAQSLRASRERHASDNAQLEQLRQFKAEYESRLVELTAQGMDPRQLEDYRRFLASLNEAISRQEGAVSSSSTAVSAERDRWVRSAMHSSGMDDFLARRRLEYARAEDSREQRLQDEAHASRVGHQGPEEP